MNRSLEKSLEIGLAFADFRRYTQEEFRDMCTYNRDNLW